MIKKHVTIILLCISLLSCRDENLNNISNIRLNATNDFRIESITPGSNGTIWCLGRKTNNNVEANQYDATFNLIKTIDLKALIGIDGTTIMQADNNGGWLVAKLIEESPIVHIEVQVLNEEFEQIKSFRPKWVLKTLYPTLINFVALDGGDYILNYSRYFNNNDECIAIRLNSKLEPIWEALFENSNHQLTDFIETSDGQIQVASFNSRNRPTTVGQVIYYLNPRTYLHVGLIDSKGEIVSDSQLYVESHHASPIGISQTNDGFMFNFITNDEHIQQYVSMSFDGTEIHHVQLGFNYINHQIIDGYSYGHFPLGKANPLPRKLKPGQGHLIYSEVDKKLQFLEVSHHPELTWKFPINLPEFD